MEEDTVTSIEEKGDISYVFEGHEVEHVTAILERPYRYAIYRRNNCDKLRVEIGERRQGHDVSDGEARDGN